MTIKQLTIPIFLALLATLVAVMARTLWVDLENLSTAGNDNAQWTILQLDTEFANLYSTLLEQAAREEIDRDAIRLRTDIALSRIDLVSQGNASDIIESDEGARALLGPIHDFAEEAAVLVDGDLDADDVKQLTERTAATAMFARQLALRGIQSGAERAEARRKEFAAKLRNTGLVAIFLLGALGAVLVILNQLLSHAREKDKALSASSKRLESTIFGSLDAIVTSNGVGDVLDFNPAAERIFDWKKEELSGLRTNILLPEPDRLEKGQDAKAISNPFVEFVGRGRIEIVARRRRGEVFPAELTVTSAGDGSEALFVAYLRDISTEKLNEQALIDAKERAERTDRAKSHFLTVMSHEMRTPLNGVLGVLDLLRTTKLSERQSRYVDVATASSEVLMRQVNEALDITRIETGSLVLSMQRFNLAEEIRRVSSVLDPLAKEKGIVLSLVVDPGMEMQFIADGNRVGQIVTNLLGNAIKFTHAGTVEVSVTGIHAKSETLAKIVVTDTGIGIPREFIEAIFEDFVALSHSSGRMSRSDGLGLSISRKTARLMGGDISVSSIEGSGSEFTLTLPLKRAGKDDQPDRDERAYNSISDAKGVDILIVEDNSINRGVLREMLEGLGHSVAVAEDGNAGQDIAMRQPFDLIFMDIDMPGIDGISLTEKLRQTDGPNRETRIQGLTAYGEEEFFGAARAVGMNGFSTKPIRMQNLRGILRDEHLASSATLPVSAVIDQVVFQELHGALGERHLCENVEKFFQEIESLFAEMKASGSLADSDDLVARLHNLSGAAAIFGFQRLREGAAEARVAAGKSDGPDPTATADHLEFLSNEARKQFLELKSTMAPRKAARATNN